MGDKDVSLMENLQTFTGFGTHLLWFVWSVNNKWGVIEICFDTFYHQGEESRRIWIPCPHLIWYYHQFHLDTLGITWKLICDDEFIEVKFTLDNLMNLHTQEGVGVSVKKAEILSFTDEDLLWSLGLLGYHTPEVLLHTVVFTVGMYCALSTGKEHQSLRSPGFKSKFDFLIDDDGKTYIRSWPQN